MASIQKTLKTNKTGSKLVQREAEVTASTSQRGHGHLVGHATNQRSATIPRSPSPQRRFEAALLTTPHSASEYPRYISSQAGPNLSMTPLPGGIETRPRHSPYRSTTPHQKPQQVQTAVPHTVNICQNVSPVKEEATRRGSENKPGQVVYSTSLSPDAKSSRHLSFTDQKDNLQSQNLQEEDPPSKVQNPQGVRVPRKSPSHPKDEAVQTDSPRKILTGEVRAPKSCTSPQRGSSRVIVEHRTVQRRIPGTESEIGPQTSVFSEPKATQRDKKLASPLKLSVLRDLDGGHRIPPPRSEPESAHKHSVYTETKPSSKVLTSPRVESNIKSSIRDTEVSRRVTVSPAGQSVQSTLRTVPEVPHTFPEVIQKQQMQRTPETNYMSPGLAARCPETSQKPSIHAELELTPRPLPPRSLPKYGPDSSWWALLNPENEMPQSQLTTPDFEPKSPPPLDPLEYLFEMDSDPFCEDLLFQREKASPLQPSLRESPSLLGLSKVPQAPKHTSKQPIQRFNAFFLGM